MSDRVKYGIITAIVWLVALVALIYVSSVVRDVELINGTTDVIGLIIFGMLSTAAWFWIGYKIRGKYVLELEYYKSQHESFDEIALHKEFKQYFIYKRSKLFIFLFLTAIPWYVLNPLRVEYTMKDYVILSIFFVLALAFVIIYFRGKQKYRSR